MGNFRERSDMVKAASQRMKKAKPARPPAILPLLIRNDGSAVPSPRYPARLRERLGEAAPAVLSALGNPDLLSLPKTAFFCSTRCPGSVILAAYDQAALWRDSGRCIIGGFHSPVEQECLRILLRGASPIIVCPARGLPRRIRPEWRTPLESGHLLILSGFASDQKRVTSDLALRRNALVAALSDGAVFAHIRPGGQSESLVQHLRTWQLPFSTLG